MPGPDEPRARAFRRAAAAALAASLASGGVSGCGESDDPRPNIVLVSVDTLTPGALRVYEPAAPSNPHLERFARQSVVFEQAVATAPWTLPSHASLLTGLYSDRHGAVHEELRLDDGAETLAGALERAGYETVGFSDGVFVDGAYGFAAGFERFNEQGGDTPAGRMHLPRAGAFTQETGASLFDRCQAFLRDRRSPKPFFLFVQTYSVHDYFRERSWAVRQLPGVALQTVVYYVECLYGIRHGTPADWDTLRGLYRAEVAHLDAGFGALLDTLDETGRAGNTIVMFVSDHGEAFEPESGRMHHGGRLNADQLHVPLMVRAPSLAPARRADSVSLVDVFPTLLELAGAPVPESIDGRSFANALRGGARLPDRPLYAHDYYFLWMNGRRAEAQGVSKSPFATAVITGDRWFIDNAHAPDELYARDGDPEQRSNLYAAGDTVKRLSDLLAARGSWQPPSVKVEPDEQRTARMRELGYVGK